MVLPEITTDLVSLNPRRREEALGGRDVAHDDGDMIEALDHLAMPFRYPSGAITAVWIVSQCRTRFGCELTNCFSGVGMS